MDRLEFGRRLDAIVIPEGTASEEMVKAVMPIREAISEKMPGYYVASVDSAGKVTYVSLREWINR